MGNRIHIYALPGLPLHVDDLMPQPLLARCCGTLSAQGHSVLIIDEGSVDKLDSPGVTALSEAMAEHLEHPTRRRDGWAGRFSARERFFRRTLDAFRGDRVTRVMACHSAPTPELALIQIRRPKDVLCARLLGRKLKERHGNLVVAVAGDFVEQFSRVLLQGCMEFDVACLGSPETVMASLARNIRHRDGWGAIPGLIFRDGTRLAEGLGGGLRIDPRFSSADYHPARYPGLLDSGKIKLFTLPQTTGRAHRGHYCGETLIQKRVVRECRQLRSDLENLHRLYGAEVFHVSGSHTPAEMVQGFAAECLSLPFSVRYSRDAHVHELSPDVAQALSVSGCEAVGLSLLTGSQRTLSDYYGENWTISEAESSLRHVRSHGLYIHTAVTFPCPADDRHTRAETVRIMRRNRPDGVRINLPTLVPGSAWFQRAHEFQFSVSPKRLAAWVCNPPFAATLQDEITGLPFQIGDLRASSAVGLCGAIATELEELAVSQVAGAAVALMARVSGFAGREHEFTVPLEDAALRLDLAALRDTIELFNVRATASINTVDLFPAVPVKKVVGN